MRIEDERKVNPDSETEPFNTAPEEDCSGPTEPASDTPESARPKLVHDADAIDENLSPEEAEDEADYRAMRRDLPGVKGASAIGIAAINTSKQPAGKNEFFRAHPTFNPVVNLVVNEVGMERQYCTATDEMEKALEGIGISMKPHVLYLTVSETGAIRIVPVRCPDDDGGQNEYSRTLELALIKARKEWVRVFSDTKNGQWKNFPAQPGRFSDPVWPALKHAKIFRLAFRDKGHRIDSHQHPLFVKWVGRAADKK
jgi:hypothetical protein